MTDDPPGASVVRPLGATPPSPTAKPKQPSKSTNLKTRTVGSRRNKFEMPADIGYEDDGMEIGVPSGDVVQPVQGLDPAMVAARRMVIRAVRKAVRAKRSAPVAV